MFDRSRLEGDIRQHVVGSFVTPLAGRTAECRQQRHRFRGSSVAMTNLACAWKSGFPVYCSLFSYIAQMSASDEGFKIALEEAKKGAREGGIPIGACLVDRHGKVLGRGHNLRVQKGSATIHVRLQLYVL